jgi:allantoin racemase|tara:strand:- start:116 stop:784 length:669 start_codon:yes stop_codon:yes gene_type:complete
VTREIRLLVPVHVEGMRLEEDVQQFAGRGARVSVAIFAKSAINEEGLLDEFIAVPEMVRLALEADGEGVDALIIDCMGDTGLAEMREAVAIPVYGPTQTSMAFTSALRQEFSFLTMLAEHHAEIAKLAKKYELDAFLGPGRSLGMSIPDAMVEVQRYEEALLREAVGAVRQDGAEAIVLGCTSMSGMGPWVRQGLADAGIADVTVVDPIPLAIQTAAEQSGA